MVADIFTKSPYSEKFTKLREMAGIKEMDKQSALNKTFLDRLIV